MTRSGGFAGLTVRASLDTAELEPEDAQELRTLVEHAGLDELSRRSPLRGTGADRFQYDLTVTEGERQRRVVAAEAAAPPELRALLERVLRSGSAG